MDILECLNIFVFLRLLVFENRMICDKNFFVMTGILVLSNNQYHVAIKVWNACFTRLSDEGHNIHSNNIFLFIKGDK